MDLPEYSVIKQACYIIKNMESGEQRKNITEGPMHKRATERRCNGRGGGVWGGPLNT